jgi:nicotinamidase-related amidase
MNKNSVLLVVDVMNDFVHPDGAGPIPEELSPGLLTRTHKLVEHADSVSAKVFFIADTHEEDEDCFRLMGMKKHAIRGSWGWQPPDVLSALKSVETIEKKNFSAFHMTNLFERLQQLRPDAVYLAGVYTDVCVMTTCIDAHQYGFPVRLVTDCTESLTTERKERGLASVAQLCGASALVTSTDLF